ncbi:MAG: alkaline phosphatase family protein [Candidatus Glassbacteria bacterium]
MERRLIVIGLDGATFGIIDPMVRENKLPVISRLMDEGGRSILQSSIPPLTVPAWPCFYTGKNPGKFGAFDFFVRRDREIERIVNRLDVKANSVWGILSHKGLRSIVMNVPTTYPPEPIDGVIVSGMLTPRGRSFVHPPHYRERLDQFSGGYLINEDSALVNKPHGKEFLAGLIDVAVRQKKAFMSLLETEKWDFAMIVFRGTDIVQHVLWEYPDKIHSFYATVDSLIGEIIGAFPETSVLIMSDHGFGPYRYVFDLNKWLIEEGYLKVMGEVVDPSEELALLRQRGGEEYTDGKRGTSFIRWLGKHGLHKKNIRKLLPRAMIDGAARLLPKLRTLPDVSYKVDFSHSRAHAVIPFVSEAYSVHLISKREDYPENDSLHGYGSLRSEIMQKLKELRNPHTGRRIFETVYSREELFRGEFLDRAPDIICAPEDDILVPAHITEEGEILYEARKVAARHRCDGVLIAHGRNFDMESFPEVASILDLAPSILHFFGLDIDPEMDGEVLGIFESEVARHDHIRYSTYPFLVESISSQEGKGADEEILKRLKGLGYL